MKNTYDLRQLLKKFGSFIYTGTRLGDLDMMEMEIKQLYDQNMISVHDYTKALLVIKKEKNMLKK